MPRVRKSHLESMLSAWMTTLWGLAGRLMGKVEAKMRFFSGKPLSEFLSFEAGKS